MSFNAIRDFKILAKISGFTVYADNSENSSNGIRLFHSFFHYNLEMCDYEIISVKYGP